MNGGVTSAPVAPAGSSTWANIANFIASLGATIVSTTAGVQTALGQSKAQQGGIVGPSTSAPTPATGSTTNTVLLVVALVLVVLAGIFAFQQLK